MSASSPPNPSSAGTKRSRSPEEPTRRVAGRTEPAAARESDEKAMLKILFEGLRSIDEEACERSITELLNEHFDPYKDDKQALAGKQSEFYQLGGHIVIVNMMQSHQDSRTIQTKGIAVLLYAAFAHKELGVAIAKVEGVETILQAMKTFPQDTLLIRFGFMALHKLACGSEGARISVTTGGTLEFVVERMKHFSDTQEIVKAACNLLATLSVFVQFRSKILETGALSVLSSAYDRYKDNDAIQRAACDAMKMLLQSLP